jgi:opacity protein-like surface antigen
LNKILSTSLAVSLLSTLAYAGPKYEITPMIGKKVYNYSDDAPRFDDGEVLVGVRGNVYFSERGSVQLGLEASKGNKMGTGTPTADHGAETDLERGMINLQYDVPSRGKITPFVMAGMGYEKLHRDEPSTNVDSQAFLNAGAGLKYAVNNRVDVIAEGRVIHKVEDKDNDAIASVGVGFKFGNSTCKSAAVKGIPVKALTMKELAALTPKKPPVEVAPVAPVEPVAAPVVDAKVEAVTSAPEVVDTKIVYDSNDVNVCNMAESESVTESSDSVSVDEGYFVQVIALRKNSPDVITSRLDAKGYDYTLREDGSLTRVLVGPYSSRTEAAKALKGLKRIRRDAFIYHAK